MKPEHQDAEPYVIEVACKACKNQNFRSTVWTGDYLQMTLMSICPQEEIGWEIHHDTDQMLRVEHGEACVQTGRCRGKMEHRESLSCGDAVFVPAGTWHNVTNTGDCKLKLSSIYAPPNHHRKTIHRTKEEAEAEEMGGKKDR